MPTFVAYYRVSTDKQGIRGLGMEAQRECVTRYLNGRDIIAEFQEVESGRVDERPELEKALALCKEERAVLLIAKLDRLSRSAHFLLGLRDSGVEFVACDMPNANRLTIGILAVIAEHEREMISQRTKEALAAAKKRGVKLGNPRYQEALAGALQRARDRSAAFRQSVLPVLREIQGSGVTSLKGIARCLNSRGVKTLNGCAFGHQTVKDILAAAQKISLTEPNDGEITVG